jgi:hydrogenase maturation protein HypF
VAADTASARHRVTVRGAVQGVGFRPFIHRLASELAVSGWVRNCGDGVTIEIEGPGETLERFAAAVETDCPPLAFVRSVEVAACAPVGSRGFEIRPSARGAAPTALVLPDIATCEACLRELFDPSDRRYLYPFTNCTHCGPRFTIIDSLPYDRPRTSMRRFEMCARCRAEYENPTDRRFHAQPIACHACGPQLSLWDTRGRAIGARHEAFLGAARAIRSGGIVAVKGLGGFHLVCDARAEETVARLRALKGRDAKPFALMFPSLADITRSCEVTREEERLLRSHRAPIVLLDTRDGEAGEAWAIAPSVARGCPGLGVMLPYTPLHHMLLHELGAPIVATSGNRAGAPLCTDEHDALERLRGVADLFLVHDRPILRHVDDSIVRVAVGGEMVMRRARGYVPEPVTLDREVPPLIAVGGHQKSAGAVSRGRDVLLTQHIGDLETKETRDALARTIADTVGLNGLEPVATACDLHPEYASTTLAEGLGLPVVRVQHHHAHVAACVAEHGVDLPAFGVSWDGTGWGPDRTVWGGELFRIGDRDIRRVAHFRRFRLPGGDRAVREPRRAAAGVLHELLGAQGPGTLARLAGRVFSDDQRSVCERILERGINAPRTSSVGRLFDAVASMLGLLQVSSFEGQAAMLLEAAARGAGNGEAYPFEIRDGVVDWGPMVRAIIGDLDTGIETAAIAGRFHGSLVGIVVGAAEAAGLERVVLSGGCFQNRVLLEGCVGALRRAGFTPFWHQRVPPNDGGLALGQLVIAANMLKREDA